jgi:hypothetical protein
VQQWGYSYWLLAIGYWLLAFLDTGNDYKHLKRSAQYLRESPTANSQ